MKYPVESQILSSAPQIETAGHVHLQFELFYQRGQGLDENFQTSLISAILYHNNVGLICSWVWADTQYTTVSCKFMYTLGN